MVVNKGYTLVEMIVVIVVLSVSLTGVTLVINQTVRQSPEGLVQTRAMELAQTYLDEILAKRFDERSGQGGIPRCDSTDNNALTCSASMGSDSEASRLFYDDVDDYHGLNEQPPQSIATGSLTAMGSIYGGYRVQVSVSYAGSEIGLSNNRHAKRITVSVTTPLGNTVPVSMYRVNF